MLAFSRRTILLGSALALTGCAAILGLDDVGITEETSADAGGGSSSSSSGAPGTDGSVRPDGGPEPVGDASADSGGSSGGPVSNGLRARELAVGSEESCVIDERENVRCWEHGSTVAGSIKRTEPNGSALQASSLAMGDKAGCAIGKEGGVYCWGRLDLLISNEIETDTTSGIVVEISGALGSEPDRLALAPVLAPSSSAGLRACGYKVGANMAHSGLRCIGEHHGGAPAFWEEFTHCIGNGGDFPSQRLNVLSVSSTRIAGVFAPTGTSFVGYTGQRLRDTDSPGCQTLESGSPGYQQIAGNESLFCAATGQTVSCWSERETVGLEAAFPTEQLAVGNGFMAYIFQGRAGARFLQAVTMDVEIPIGSGRAHAIAAHGNHLCALIDDSAAAQSYAVKCWTINGATLSQPISILADP